MRLDAGHHIAGGGYSFEVDDGPEDKTWRPIARVTTHVVGACELLVVVWPLNSSVGGHVTRTTVCEPPRPGSSWEGGCLADHRTAAEAAVREVVGRPDLAAVLRLTSDPMQSRVWSLTEAGRLAGRS